MKPLLNMDNDGDIGFNCRNLGLNYKYKATQENPFEIFVQDLIKQNNLIICV